MKLSPSVLFSVVCLVGVLVAVAEAAPGKKSDKKKDKKDKDKKDKEDKEDKEDKKEKGDKKEKEVGCYKFVCVVEDMFYDSFADVHVIGLNKAILMTLKETEYGCSKMEEGVKPKTPPEGRSNIFIYGGECSQHDGLQLKRLEEGQGKAKDEDKKKKKAKVTRSL